MTIQSWGYGPTSSNPNGTIAPNQVWAQMQWTLGRSYWIYGPDQVTCTPVANGTRQVTIGTGFLGGWGILDQITAAETLTLPSVTTGTKYYMIAARRNWDTTQATSLVAIDAGTTGNTTLPPRNTSPGTGTGDDQPLWMVPLTAGQTVPGTPIPLGVYGTGNSDMYIRNQLALQYLTGLGTEVWLGDNKWRRRLNSAGTASEWAQTNEQISGTTLINYGDSWGFTSGGNHFAYYNADSRQVRLYLNPRRYDSSLQFDSNGNLGDNWLGTLLDSRLIPSEYVPMEALAYGGATTTSSTSFGIDCYIEPGTGRIMINSGPPNLYIPNKTTAAVSVRIGFTYTLGSA